MENDTKEELREFGDLIAIKATLHQISEANKNDQSTVIMLRTGLEHGIHKRLGITDDVKDLLDEWIETNAAMNQALHEMRKEL